MSGANCTISELPAEIAARSASRSGGNKKGGYHEQGNLQPGDAAAADRLFARRQGQQGHAGLYGGPGVGDASGKLVGEGDFEAQVEQVFKNLKLALEAAGATMADIVKLNTYLVAEVSQDDLPKMRAVRDRYMNKDKPPASTLVVVSRLARPGWLIEIEAVAAID